MKHLEEYIIKNIEHRFVLIEKINKFSDLFISNITETSWKNVVFFDKNILLAVNKDAKSIMLLSYIGKETMGVSDSFNIFNTYYVEDKRIFCHISIIFDINYGDETKNFKIRNFIDWYIHILSIFRKYFNPIREMINNYEEDRFSDVESQLTEIRNSLKEESRKTTDYFYEKTNQDFFNENPI